jgi:hypothetical protein
MTESATSRVVAVARGVESSHEAGRRRGPHEAALDPWIGRWMNEGYTVDGNGDRGVTINTSDVYEWAPGGFFVLHTAYGRIGDFDVGGIEISGFDEESGNYVSYFFDSQGNVMRSRLSVEGHRWTFQGENTRGTVDFSNSDRLMTVLHERSDDGRRYVASMRVTLTKVG